MNKEIKQVKITGDLGFLGRKIEQQINLALQAQQEDLLKKIEEYLLSKIEFTGNNEEKRFIVSPDKLLEDIKKLIK